MSVPPPPSPARFDSFDLAHVPADALGLRGQFDEGPATAESGDAATRGRRARSHVAFGSTVLSFFLRLSLIATAVLVSVACGGAPTPDALSAPAVARDAPPAPPASATPSASAGATASQPTRIQQCNALVEKVNAAGQAVHTSGGSNKNHVMQDMADAIDAARADIAAVGLQDTRLARYKDEYMKMLDDISAGARRMQVASDGHDQPAMQVALKQIHTASEDEKRIVDALNTYCKTGT